MADDNVVYVGKKNSKNYVLAVVTQMNMGANEIVLRARGKSISKAVDVAEMFKNRFTEEYSSRSVNIFTEELKNSDDSIARVSAIEIVLSKGKL